MRRVLLCMPEALEVLKVPEVTRLVLLCTLEAVEGELRSLEAIRCVLLCMLEAVEGVLYLPRCWRCRRWWRW